MGCYFHGCQTCFDLSTNNTHLNKSMGDLHRETMRWIARVTNNGYMLSFMWECEWDNLVRENSEIKEHVESYSLSSIGPDLKKFGMDDNTFECLVK